MHTTKKYVFKTITFYVQLFCFVLFVHASHENTARKPDAFANKVNLSGNYIVEWTVNETAKSIEFRVNVTVDEKGWILLGFMHVPSNKSETKNLPSKLSDSRGDFVVTWPSSASERTTLVSTFSFQFKCLFNTSADRHICICNYSVRNIILGWVSASYLLLLHLQASKSTIAEHMLIFSLLKIKPFVCT